MVVKILERPKLKIIFNLNYLYLPESARHWETIPHGSHTSLHILQKHELPFCSRLSFQGCLHNEQSFGRLDSVSLQSRGQYNKDNVFLQSRSQAGLLPIIKIWVPQAQGSSAPTQAHRSIALGSSISPL